MARPAQSGSVCELDGGEGFEHSGRPGRPLSLTRTARERTVERRVRRLVPDAVWAEAEALLPAWQPSSRGGRPRANDRAALAGIVHVLRSGKSWARLPQELGFGSGMTCWRRLREWQAAGIWPELERALRRSGAGAERLPWERLQASAWSAAGAAGRGTTREA